jgi:uncharacterized protein YecE (DUF72 family)
MKFGQTDHIADIDFTLPPIEATDPRGLQGKPADSFVAFVGLPRWGSKAWLGDIYPPGTKAKDYLTHYSRALSCIELNSTHYRIPSETLVQQWYQASQPGFIFCPKVPQVISHVRQLVHCEAELAAFTSAIAGFGDRLGHSFVQLHESFGPKLLGNLHDFLQRWPSNLPLAIEFRHPDWFATHQLLPAAADLLTQHQVAPVITDVAGRRDVLHQSMTAPTVMIRLVGNGLVSTDYTRADAWMERLSQWRQQGLERAYLFAHQPDDGQALRYGRALIDRANAQLDQAWPLPGLPPDDNPQMSLF